MLSLRGLILLWLFVLSGENCQHQNSHDVDDLDHRVNSRTGGILVGITNRVTGDSRVVSVRYCQVNVNLALLEAKIPYLTTRNQ